MGFGDDMITFMADSDESEFVDGFSRSYWVPGVDNEQNLTGEFVYNSELEEVYFKVLRKLDTGDTDDDYLIQLDRDFDMSWAINTGTSRRGRKHNKRKRMPNVYLASTGAYTWGLAKI